MEEAIKQSSLAKAAAVAVHPKSETQYEITYTKAKGSDEVHEADELWVPRAIKGSERVQGRCDLPPFGSAVLNIHPDDPKFEAVGHAKNKRNVNGTKLIVYIKKVAGGESEAAATSASASSSAAASSSAVEVAEEKEESDEEDVTTVMQTLDVNRELALELLSDHNGNVENAIIAWCGFFD